MDDILEGNFHPALKQAIRDLRKRAALDVLCAMTHTCNGEELNNDAQIAAAAREFVFAHRVAKPVHESVKVHFVDKKYENVDC